MKRYKLKKDIGNKKKKKIKFGRKKARSREKGEHNKFSQDNLRRKTKHLVIDNLMNYFNETLKYIYKENIGQGILIKRFFIMGQDQIKIADIKYNQNFLNKTLGTIFSEDISKKITNYPPDHNKNLIMRLTKEKDKTKKIFFSRLFNLTFREVIGHINGNKIIYELNGLKGIDEIVKKYENEPRYHNIIKKYILNYDTITERKKPRKPKLLIKKKEETD